MVVRYLDRSVELTTVFIITLTALVGFLGCDDLCIIMIGFDLVGVRAWCTVQLWIKAC